MSEDILFKKIVLSHVKNATERAHRQEREMGDIKSNLEVFKNDLTVLKDRFIGLEDKKVADLQKKIEKLENQMTRVYAIAGAASLVGGWLIPHLIGKFL